MHYTIINFILYYAFLICRLNYSANYADAEGITITAVDFSDIAGLEFYSTGFLQYFVDRGYTANVDIQVASYDWRLAPGKNTFNY